MKVLPLKEAYRFGDAHALQGEMAAIRDMEIEWDLSYTSSVRRGFVVHLLTQRNLLETFKQECWPEGGSAWGQRKTDFWLRLKGRYDDFLAGRGGSDSGDKEEDEDQRFAAEADLRDYLANNLGVVERGLRLYEKNDQKGVEFPVDDGRIDILAVDRTGRFVVFELKLARGRNKALGQLVYYMAWVDKNLGKGPCRGAIVAKEITDDLVLAARRVEGVSLFRYTLSVAVEKAS